MQVENQFLNSLTVRQAEGLARSVNALADPYAMLKAVESDIRAIASYEDGNTRLMLVRNKVADTKQDAFDWVVCEARSRVRSNDGMLSCRAIGFSVGEESLREGSQIYLCPETQEALASAFQMMYGVRPIQVIPLVMREAALLGLSQRSFAQAVVDVAEGEGKGEATFEEANECCIGPQGESRGYVLAVFKHSATECMQPVPDVQTQREAQRRMGEAMRGQSPFADGRRVEAATVSSAYTCVKYMIHLAAATSLAKARREGRSSRIEEHEHREMLVIDGPSGQTIERQTRIEDGLAKIGCKTGFGVLLKSIG